MIRRVIIVGSLGIAGATRLSAQRPPAPAPATATAPPHPSTDSTRLATITYISGQSAYISAGRLEGVREGMLIDLLRAGSLVGTLRATFLASHSSSCEIISSAEPATVGDTVRFRAARDQATAQSNDSVRVQAAPAARSLSWRRPIRGRIGLQLLNLSQPTALDGSGQLTQPSAEIHVEGTSLASGLLSFTVDARSRHTVGATAATAPDERTLIYQASLSMTHQESGARLSIGRQYSAALASVGLFDGMTAELNRAHWGLGVFSGAQPDVATMQYSTAIRENGAYVQLHNRPEGTVPWSVSTGAIGSRDLGQLDREFGFTQLTFNSTIVSIYAMQEVDFNRGWKRAAGEPAVSPTSTFATLSVRPLDELSLQAGVDNRRNVRLYRDYISPETVFDDAFRQGFWGGASYSLFRAVRIGADARSSRGGAAGEADSYTGSFALGPILSHRLELRTRSTRYHTSTTAGWLNALTAGADPIDLLHLELSGGVRTQQLLDSLGTAAGVGAMSTPSDSWVGASVDVNVGRSWYVVLSATHDNAVVDKTNLVYASVVYRF